MLHEHLTLYDILVHTLISALIYLCTCTNFISEVTNIDFGQICHFHRKVIGWVGLEISVILTQTVGRFNISVTP